MGGRESMPGSENATAMLVRLEQYLDTFDWSGLTRGKQVILESFLLVATREGIANVSMRSLAAAAGVKPPTMYFHFPDGREQIVAAAMRWHYNSFAHALKTALAECRTPDSYWSTLISFHVSQQLQRPENDIWDALIATDRIAKTLPEDLRKEVEDWEDFCDYMYFSIAQDLGASCTMLEARALRKLIDCINSWWSWDGSEANLNQAIEYSLRLSQRIIEI
ncbi:TetR/AcrR family transcriptional regulator [Pseudomonas putida]|uniref:TetR/AcrR family transcriptional regulator n=2 Tax=Pseudomonas TaxID=286 RepID=A0A5R8ZH40_9PSED|nr:TetR/AcrR family transcriptional regulator [Pseudomonas putida]MBH3459186.1 TetR/AcrR family transcriptional regulator [Pseudomonas putida]TLP65082.1 TetR/AcrR family transcriptional regulator [Pseudomonas mosselii]